MSVSTTELLEGVVARLRAAMPDVAVDLYPEKPDGYRLNHPVGALLVTFLGAVFGDQKMTTGYVQERTPQWRVVILFRQLYGRAGALAYLDQVRLTLQRYRPAGCRYACRAVAENFLDEESGIWRYTSDWQAVVPAQIDEAVLDPATPDAWLVYHHDLDDTSDTLTRTAETAFEVPL